MMGYGQPHNTVKEIGTKLYARTMILKDEDHKHIIIVHLEQAFVTLAIKEEILRELSEKYSELKITDANLLITAQHTHSAPGGYSHYPFYNFTIPGFQLKVFHTICHGIMEAIKVAKKDMQDVNLTWGIHSIAADKEIAYNRSMGAYLNNEDAEKLTKEEWHLAVNRNSEGLRITDSSGKEKAFLNWFGVHCTSISSFNHRIHHDNKGVAADLYEKNHPGTIAFFFQEAAGDVSPNFVWDKSLGRMRGKYKDQYENAAFNGELQYREAEKIKCDEVISGKLQTWHQFMDMGLEVGVPAHGVAFFEGTKEGPGVNPVLGRILKSVSRVVKQKHLMTNPEHKMFYEAHAPKDILLDHRNGSFLGIPLAAWKKLPPIPEPAVESMRVAAKNESINTLPWVPSILPFQLLKIGTLLIVAVPGEITTVAAKRLKAALSKKIEGTGVNRIIISSYANAYMGYITTPGEYVTQSYEAGHTVYGRETLRGIIKGFTDLLEGNDSYIKTPFHFPADELERRTVK